MFIFQSEYSDFCVAFRVVWYIIKICILPWTVMFTFSRIWKLDHSKCLKIKEKKGNINTMHSLVTQSWLWSSVIKTEEQRMPSNSGRKMPLMEERMLCDRVHFKISSWYLVFTEDQPTVCFTYNKCKWWGMCSMSFQSSLNKTIQDTAYRVGHV